MAKRIRLTDAAGLLQPPVVVHAIPVLAQRQFSHPCPTGTRVRVQRVEPRMAGVGSVVARRGEERDVALVGRD